MKRLFLSVVLAASLLVAPLAHADTGYVPIGDPYTDTIQLWSDLASVLSSLANDFAVLFDGHDFAARSTGGTQEQPASAATAATSLASAAQTAHPATSSPLTSQPREATPTANTYITNPEKVIENPLASSDFVTQSELAYVLLALSTSPPTKFAPTIAPAVPLADGNPLIPYAAENNITNLSGVTITSPTITGGSVSAASLSGTLTNAVNTASGEIDSLTGTALTYTNGTTTSATSTNLFASNLAAAVLAVSGTSTLTHLNLSSFNCSTFGNGGKLTTDALGNVTCAADQEGSGSTVGGADTQVQFNSGGSFTGSSAFTFASSSALLTVTNASTTNVTANYSSSTNLVASNATSTNFFAVNASTTNATSTNLFASLANFTTGVINTLSGTQLTYTAASTTILSASGEGSFGTASTTNLVVSGAPSGFLQTNAQGSVSATSTFNAGSLFGTLASVNGTALPANGAITVTAASSTLLGDNSAFSGVDDFTNVSGNFAGTWQTFSPSHFQAAGTYLTGIGNYATTTGAAISISTSTQTFNGLTFGNSFAVSPSGISVAPTVSGTLNNAGLSHSTIVVNGTTLTLGDAADTVTAASSTLLGDNNAFSGVDTFKVINLSATSSSLLGVNASGEVVATSSIGTNLLAGALGIINGTPFSAGGSITVGSASTTLLSDNNSFDGSNAFSSLLKLLGGLLSGASSTIGNGAQAGGLTVSGGATTTQNLIVQGTGTSTFAGNIGISGNITPSADNTYMLGTPTDEWKDVYIGPGSLFVNGQEVVHTDASQNVVLTANSNQNLEMQTSGTGSVLINSSGTGNIQLAGPVQITGGENFSTSNSMPVLFNDGVEPGNLELTGNAIQATNTNGGISFSPNGNGSTYFTNGDVGIGTTNPLSKLEVEGAVAAQNFSATSTTATSTFADGINLTAGCFAVNGTCIGASSASTTLLGDNNAFSGVDSFTNASSNFAGTWQTLSPSHFQSAGTYLTGIGNYATTTSTSISVSTSTLSWNGLTFGNSFVVSASGITVTPTVSGTISNTGLTNSTIGATSPNDTLALGAAASLGSTFTADLNLAHSNNWTGLQQFQNASTTIFSAYGPAYFGATATSTFATNGALTLVALGTFTSGFVSQASSTVVGNFTNTGNHTVGGTLAVSGTTGTTTIASGQGFTVGGSEFVVQQGSGNVGIGTTPSYPLDISTSAGGTSSPSMRLTSLNGESGLIFNSYAEGVGGQEPVGGIFGEASSGWVSTLHLDLNNNWGAPSIEALTVKSANGTIGVGIATTSPATTLSVAGNGYLTGGLGVGVENTTAGTIQSSGNILSGGTLAVNGSSGTTTIASGQGFTVGGSQFVVQQGSGNVGIGTSTPDVASDTYVPSVTTHADILGFNQAAGIAADIQTGSGAPPSGAVQAVNDEFSVNYNPGTSVGDNINTFRMVAELAPGVSASSPYTANFNAANFQSRNFSSALVNSLNGFITNVAIGGSGGATNASGITIGPPAFSNGGLGMITNDYGLLIDSQKTASTTNAYGIYQGGSSDLNYFAGLGTWANGFLSQASSTVVGNLTLTGTLAAQGAASIGTTLAVSGTTGTTTIASGQGFTVGGSQLVVQQGSGDVGIGTNVPTRKLKVVASTEYDGIELNNGSNPVASLTGNASGNDDGELWLGNGGTSGVVLQANGASYLTGGNVGIGTTTPDVPLALSTASNAIKLAVYDAGGTTGDYGIGAQNGYLSFGAGIGPSGTPQMVLTNAGNVGIGTTTPGSKLSLSGTFQEANGTAFFSNSAWLGTFYDTGGNNGVGIGYSPDKNGNVIQGLSTTNGYGNLVLNEYGGNVGIGTTTPNTTLTVWKGSPGSYTQYADDNAVSIAGSGNIGMTLVAPDANNTGIVFDSPSASAGVGAQMFYNYNTSLFEFNLNSGAATRNYSFLNGNVGIGTTTPRSLLFLAGTDLSSFQNSSNGLLTLQGTSGNSNYYQAIDFNASANGQLAPMARIASENTSSGSYLDFGTSNSYASGITNTALSISPSGNVGIGTTTPLQSLSVQGSILAGASTGDSGLTIYKGDASTGDQYFSILHSGNDLEFGPNTGSGGLAGFTERMRITANGNVGIGTTSPANLLDIESNASIAAMSITDAANNSGVGIQSRSGYGLLEGLTGSGSPGTLVLNAFGGNVGIGTTSPQTLLGLQGGIGVNSSQLYLGANGDVGVGYSSPSTALDVIGTLTVRNSNIADDSTLATDGNGTLFIKAAQTEIGTSPTPGMLTVTLGGNVGIGTTTPLTTLDIIGPTSLPSASGDSPADTVFRIGNSNNPNTGGVLDFGNDGGTGEWIQARQVSNYASDNPLLLNPNGGDVGIGTTDPGAFLEVDGANTGATQSNQGGIISQFIDGLGRPNVIIRGGVGGGQTVNDAILNVLGPASGGGLSYSLDVANGIRDQALTSCSEVGTNSAGALD